MRSSARAAVIAFALAGTPLIAQTVDPLPTAPPVDAPTAAEQIEAAVPADPVAPPADAATAAEQIEAAVPADPSGAGPAQRDPLEGFNRAMWGLNRGLDQALIRPAAVVYRTVTPRPARRGLSRIFANLSEPWSFVNNLLQGKPGRAFNNLGRFVVNTTIGVGGLADHATGLGLRPTPEDFGQTLAAWGVNSSTYLVLPVFGPSTIRDGVGTGVAFFADPYTIAVREGTNLSGTERLAIQAVEVVSIRSDLIDSGADAFLATSLDPYAAARSAYLQGRAAEIADEGSAAASAAPAELDPKAADAPPPSAPGDPGAAPPPAAADPASPPADPAAAPTLSFNFDALEG